MISFKDKFKYAFRGLWLGLHDVSICIQLVFMAVVCLFAWICQFNRFEWSILLLCCGMVVLAEFVNTVIERIVDFIHPQKHEKIRDIKDMAAGFVLFVSIVALLIGVLLFGGKLC